MTDIRKHGFETDAQWREYLAEIEETKPAFDLTTGLETNLREQLDVLALEVESLRKRVEARLRGHVPRMQQRRLRLRCILIAAVGAWGLFAIGRF